MTILDQSNRVDGGVRHSVAGTQFTMPFLNAGDMTSEPGVRFAAAMSAVEDANAAVQEVNRNGHLSPVGKEAKLLPIREKLLQVIGSQIDGLESFSDSLDDREAVLLAVPEIAPTDAVAATVDRELRDWWAAQSADTRAKLLKKIDGEPGHERLELALLRSPYAQLDHEAVIVRNAYNRARRLDSPVEATSIQVGREQTNWGRRALGHLVGIVTTVIADNRNGTLRVLMSAGVSEKVLAAFRFEASEVERMRYNMKAEQAIAAAH